MKNEQGMLYSRTSRNGIASRCGIELLTMEVNQHYNPQILRGKIIATPQLSTLWLRACSIKNSKSIDLLFGSMHKQHTKISSVKLGIK